MPGIEKTYENRGGELIEVVIFHKKTLCIEISIAVAIIAAGILAMVWRPQLFEYGKLGKGTILKNIQNIAQEQLDSKPSDRAATVVEETATYYKEIEEQGIIMKDTMTLEAWNDTIHFISEIVELDIGAFDEPTKAALREAYDALVEQYQATEGVFCVKKESMDIYTFYIEIEVSPEVVEELTSQGLFEFEGEGGRFSLKNTAESLERQGYQKIEE